MKGVIVQYYGKQKHPVFPSIETFNNGIDIATEKNATVRADFDGTISRIFFIKGSGKAVLINHGEYFTVYSGLKDIAVSHGIVQQNGSTYSMGDKKLGYYKNWRNDEETWKSILPKLESSINEKYRYGKSLEEGAILEQEDE